MVPPRVEPVEERGPCAADMEVAGGGWGEPDAGRFLKGWAHAAGFTDVRASSSTWTFADPETCRWWGELWADRTELSAFGEQAAAYGLATHTELAEIAAGWREWSAHPDAYFMVPHGEVLARVNTHLTIRNLQKTLQAQNSELQQKNKELQQALSSVNTLSGLLPICAHCKKIRDDAVYWQDVEIYIRDHSDAVLSHGLCPDCIVDLYPEMYPDQSE